MNCKINGVDHEVPSDISIIPLHKFVEYYQKYGKQLDEELLTCEDIDFHVDKEALSWYSFWTGYDFFAIETVELTDILLQYRIMRNLLKASEEQSREFPALYEWNGDKWLIQDYRLVPGSLMSFNELITGKEIVRQIETLGQGKWEALIYLCCIYFRKLDEPYKESMIDGERYELMKKLPLNLAMSVAFFLNDSIHIYLKHLASSLGTEIPIQQPK